MELLNFDNLKAVLKEYGEAVAEVYKRNLADNKRPTTENTLASTVEIKVQQPSGNEWTVSLNLQEYWKYIEDGTGPSHEPDPRGKYWPPYGAILNWVRIKPVIPRPNDKGKIPTPEQLAHAIKYKIHEEGTEGSHDLRDAIEEVNERFSGRFVYALREDAENILKVLVGEIQGALPPR